LTEDAIKFETNNSLTDQGTKAKITQVLSTETANQDLVTLESKPSTAVTSTKISPLVQAPPKINIGSLLEKRPF